MKSSARWTVLATAVVALLVSGCTSAVEPSAPQPEPEVLSASDAGGIYLEAVCPVNAAWDNVDVEVDRLRLIVSRGEEETARFAAAMKKLGSASSAAAQALNPKTLDKAGSAWPKAASDEIAEVRNTLTADQKQAAEVAKLNAAQAVDYAWQGTDEVGSAASAARAALGLPEDGESACAQWQEQAEEQAKEQAREQAEQKEQDTTQKKSS